MLHTDTVEIVEKPEGTPNTFALELSDFLDAVRSDQPPPIDGAAGYYTTAMVELAVRTAQDGKARDVAPSPIDG